MMMRVVIFVRILIACLLFVVGGLVYTQVVQHDVYKEMSEGNRLKILPFHNGEKHFYRTTVTLSIYTGHG